ncbi:MAG: glutamate-1-semialdehyde 2,1-aminomutase [Candidatus Hydrothermarchaeota archaeon]
MRSKELFEEAKKLLCGGVNSPVRAMKPYPFYTKYAKGPRIYDIDGNSYIDYCLAYGPLILGHANPRIKESVSKQLELGWSYGTPIENEIKLAKKIVKHVPCVEMVRFVNTGTEATMGAIRLARGFTGKNKIIKVEGGFHGAHDSVLVKAGSGATTFGEPDSLGVPEDFARNTIVIPFNDPEALENIIEKDSDIACFILEPVMGNSGCILPKNNYLKEIRRITSGKDVLLIFDEVITGFRLGMGGAQEYFKVTPDIVTLGKVLGAGFPIGAFGGKKEIMEFISPAGKVYQAGTFNANPISMCAALASIEEIEEKKVHSKANSACEKIVSGLKDIIEDSNYKIQVNHIASMFSMFFSDSPVYDYKSATSGDKEKFLEFQRLLMKKGVFFPPSMFETCFLSCTHEESDIEFTLNAIESALKEVFV